MPEKKNKKIYRKHSEQLYSFINHQDFTCYINPYSKKYFINKLNLTWKAKLIVNKTFLKIRTY